MKHKYDKNTRNQLQNINQDAQIAELTTAVNDLKDRTLILEGARSVQQRLNSKFDKGMKLPNKPTSEEKESVWSKILNALR